MKRITVLVAEDHVIVREGLLALLRLDPDLEVVGEASTGRQAVRLAAKHRPAVVVMDIAMPQLNGFEATRQILLDAPATKVLVLSAYSDDEYVQKMAEIGAAGYLSKQNSGDMLIPAIKKIMSGRPYFSPSILKRMQNAARKASESGTPLAKTLPVLTSREMEVLQLVAEGAANKQMAEALGISIKTIEKHRQQLMDKLDIHNTAGLTRHAIATGVIEGWTQVGTTDD